MSSPALTSLICLFLLIAPAALQGCAPASEAQDSAQVGLEDRRVPVVVTSVTERTFEERISTQGTLVAKHSAMVSPRVDGTITDMFVEEGDRVEANKTVLFQSDKIVLTQAVEIAQQDRAVAAYARLDAEAQAVAAQAQYDKAKLDYERFLRLREQQAVTPDAMEQMEAGYAVAKAQVDRAQTAVRLRGQQEKQAEAALEIARKQLEDSLVLSPIDGWISYRGKEAGEFAGAGTPILRVTDTRVLEVSAFLPGEYYPRIVPHATQMRVRVSSIDLGLLPITYKSPEIHDQLRTFEVKSLIESPPEGVVAGAIAQVEALLDTRTSPGVPRDAIQIRDGNTVMFTVKEERAALVPVRTGLVFEGWTELTEGAPAIGAPIITSGQNMVSDGTPVDVQGEGR